MAKRKKPKSKYNPSIKKEVRPSLSVISNENLTPSLRFSTIDKIGPFNKLHFSKDSFEEKLFGHIKVRLLQYEKLNWAELTRPVSNHPMPIEKIVPTAQKRLQDINLDDYETLCQLKIDGIERLWGIREAGVFNIIWWDPYHEVYPVSKKNT